MIVNFKIIGRGDLDEIGQWMDQNMPNPPLPEPQRWSVKDTLDGRINFVNKADAIRFLLVWG